MGAKPWIPFQEVALKMGVGVLSPLGLVLHPTFGPWIAFRALLLCESIFWQDGPKALATWNPCPGCSAPCMAICPAKALTRKNVHLDKCYDYRLANPSQCFDRCLAREACPIGQEHQFSREQINYHYTFGLE